MKKKIFSSLLFGALAFATLSTVVSCKDYDDDISGLQSQVDALSKKIDDINSQITAGSVITSVESISNGVKITLSNGKTYDITNGVKGADGIAYTIGTDGYWYKDGVKTDYKAVGENGTNGTNGTNGNDGTPGTPGQDGKTIYYVPNAQTGCFDKVTAKADGSVETTEATEISWKTSATTSGGQITAVMDDDNLTLYGVKDKDGVISEEGVVISLSSDLRSLIFAGDFKASDDSEVERVLSASVPAIRFQQFSYTAQELTNKNSAKEAQSTVKDAKPTTVNPVTYAYYHVSPANVNKKDLQKLAYVLKSDVENTTRADQKSSNLTVKAEFVSIDDKGIAKVKVITTGTPAEGKYLSEVALQASKDNKDNVDEMVTSDYAVLCKSTINDLRIAHATKSNIKAAKAEDYKDYHFRRAAVENGISGTDKEAGVSDEAVWLTTKATDKPDLEIAYDGGTVSLDKYVEVHQVGATKSDNCTMAALDALGFEVQYDVVTGYEIGTYADKTPQDEFITLDKEKRTIAPRVYGSTGTSAAIGRTPVIRATLYDKNNKQIVDVAYIKVKITKTTTPDTPDTKTYSLKVGNFSKFECSKTQSVTSTVEEFNVQIYNEIGLSRDEFHNKYKLNTEYTNKDNVGTVKELSESVAGVTSYNLEWTLTDQQIWDNAEKDVNYICQYKANNGDVINIKLTSTVTAIKKQYDITHLMTANWDAAGNALFNVALDNGSTDNEDCVFPGLLDNPFTLDAESKLISDIPSFITYNYTFSKDIESVKSIGGIETKFTVSKDGKTLSIGTEEIAKITDATDNSSNVISLNKEGKDKLALKLLNTKELVIPIQINGAACGEDKKTVAITVKNSKTFNAKFVRPVNISAKASGSFIDGKNAKDEGSFISIESLIAPTNWLGNAFSKNPNYWDFYGEFEVSVDVNKAEHDANGNKEKVSTTGIKLFSPKEYTESGGKVTLDLGNGKSVDPGCSKNNDVYKVGATTSKYGFIFYQNNGNAVTKDYNLYIPVTVSYGWGEITETIVVPVKATDIKN